MGGHRAAPPVEVTSVPAAGGAPIRESEAQKVQAAWTTPKRRETEVLLGWTAGEPMRSPLGVSERPGSILQGCGSIYVFGGRAQ